MPTVRRSLGTAGPTYLMSSGARLVECCPAAVPASSRRCCPSLCDRHTVEGQVWASCSCAHHSHRSPAHLTALSRAIIGASQMGVEVARLADLVDLMTADSTR